MPVSEAGVGGCDKQAWDHGNLYGHYILVRYVLWSMRYLQKPGRIL